METFSFPPVSERRSSPLQHPAEESAPPESDPPDVCSQSFFQCWLLPCSHTLNTYGQHTTSLLTYNHPNPYFINRLIPAKMPLSSRLMITARTIVMITTAMVCLINVFLSVQIILLNSDFTPWNQLFFLALPVVF